MKFYHIADVHIGAKNKVVSAEKQNLLRGERLESLKALFSNAKEDGVSFVLIAGDLFHSKSPQTKLVKGFFDLVEEFALPVVYIKGNHDEKWEGDAPANFIVLSQEKPCISIEDVDIWSGIDDKIIRENLDKTRKNVLVLHGNVESAKDNDFIDINRYADIDFDYVAMGHVHSYKVYEVCGRPFVYSGSLFSNGFDECGEKGSVKVTLDNKAEFEFCPLAGRKFMICRVDKGEGTTTREIIDKIHEVFLKCNISKNDFVRVELVGYFNENDDKNITMIKNAFFEQFYFEIIDKTRLSIDLEKLKKESLSFKAEFIKLVEESDLTQEDKTSICLVGIEALKGEELSI